MTQVSTPQPSISNPMISVRILRQREDGKGFDIVHESLNDPGTRRSEFRTMMFWGRIATRRADLDVEGYEVYEFAPTEGYSTTHIAFKDDGGTVLSYAEVMPSGA